VARAYGRGLAGSGQTSSDHTTRSRWEVTIDGDGGWGAPDGVCRSGLGLSDVSGLMGRAAV
jgi:hypothetical protein